MHTDVGSLGRGRGEGGLGEGGLGDRMGGEGGKDILMTFPGDTFHTKCIARFLLLPCAVINPILHRILNQGRCS